MGLVNSVGNYLVVSSISGNYVQVEVYLNKVKINALDPNFEKPDVFGIDVPDLTTGIKTTNASGTGGKKIWDNMVAVAEAKLIELAAIVPVEGTPTRLYFPTRSYPHDWAAEVVV